MAAAILFGVIRFCIFIIEKIHRAFRGGNAGNERDYSLIKKIIRRYYRIFLWILLIVAFIMTLNCFILYHATPYEERFFADVKDVDEREELSELLILRNGIVTELKNLAPELLRDEEGRIAYPGSKRDMQDEACRMMREIGATEGISQLSGFYPRPKALISSDFMCQQYMQGYYFPFSMEANYNDVMYVNNKPFTMCHELAHLKGFIYEDEANFIGFLACINSDDIYFKYSGYMTALNYVNNDLINAMNTAPKLSEEVMDKIGVEPLNDLVRSDNIFVEQKEWDRINGKALIDTETVDKAADKFIDANLKINGVSDGALSYNRMVRLMLLYYRN